MQKHTDYLSSVKGQQEALSRVHQLRTKLVEQGTPFFANDNISHVVSEQDQEAVIALVTTRMQGVLDALLIDTDNDHNTADTAKRWAKMAVYELFQGRFNPSPEVTTFPNVKKVDQMYVVGPIELRSVCAHHLVPITGKAWVGMLPSAEGNLIGLSKFHRVLRHFAERPQIQEEMVVQSVDALEKLTKPNGIALVVEAHHMCCGHRGVKDSSSLMTSSEMRGLFKSDNNVRAEFLSLIRKAW